MKRINRQRWDRLNGWILVVVASVGVSAVSGSCVFGSNTTVCEAKGVRCPDGLICAANQAICVVRGGCGDGVINTEAGEVCDDGNTNSGDGCSADCRSNETCGNGIKDGNEQCESPQNKFGTPAQDSAECDSDCTAPMCGDGHVNAQSLVPNGHDSTRMHPEECEPSAPVGDEVCNADCSIARCGDGYVNPELGEECDDGAANADSADACRTNCKTPACGDGIIDTGEECDNGSGNGDAADGCRAGTCKKASCGDGVTDKDLGEACDGSRDGTDTSGCNGNNHHLNGPGSCQKPACGDGYVNSATSEDCDPGNGSNIPGAGCGPGLECVKGGMHCGTCVEIDTGEVR